MKSLICKVTEMKQKTYFNLLITVVVICLIFTIAHLIYAIKAYEHCSIIYFIAKELW